MLGQEPGHRKTILTVPLHPHMQALQAQVQNKGVLRTLDGTQIPHKLCRTLCDKSPFFSKFFRVSDAVIALVRRTQTRKLVLVGHPVKFSAVHNGASHSRPMAVHIFCGGMGHNIRSPLKRPAVDGGGKSIVHNQRHPVGMGALGKFFNVKHRQGRIGNGLPEHNPGVLPESPIQLLPGGIGTHKSHIHPHSFHGDGDQVVGSPVNGAGGNNVVPAAADVEQGVKIGGLAAAGEHARRSSLQLCDFGCHIIIGGILETGVEIAAGLQVKKFSHVLAGIIFKRGALNNRNLTGLSVSRCIPALYAYAVNLHFYTPFFSFSSIHAPGVKFNCFSSLVFRIFPTVDT